MNENFKNISSQKHLLSELANPKSKYRTSILKKAQPELVLAICESVYNLLEGKLPLDKEKKDSLLKYKHILRKLVQKNNLKYKKKILVQSGGFLSIILPTVLGLISSIFD